MEGASRWFRGDFVGETPGVTIAIFGMGLALLTKEASTLASLQTLRGGSESLPGFILDAVALVLVSLLYLRKPMTRMHRQPVAGFGVAVVTSLSMFAVFGVLSFGSVVALSNLLFALYRIGSSLLVLMWCEVLVPLGSRRMAGVMAVSGVVTALCNLLSVALRGESMAAIVAISPLAAMGCLYYFKEYNTSRRGLDPSLWTPSSAEYCLRSEVGVAGPNSTARTRALVVVALVLAVVLSRFVLSGNHLAWVGVQGASNVPLAGQLSNVAGTVAASALLMMVVLWFWNRFCALLVMVLLIAAMYFSVNTMPQDASRIVLTLIPMSMGTKLIYFVCAMAPFFSSAKSPFFEIGVMYAGSEMGVGANVLVKQLTGGQGISLADDAAMLLLVACVVVIVSVTCSSFGGKGRATVGANAPLPASAASEKAVVVRSDAVPSGAVPPLPDAVRRRCLESARSRQLTKRETEVLLLLANRFSALDISEILSISLATTKTHMRNIYAKFDTHSARELQMMLWETSQAEGK